MEVEGGVILRAWIAEQVAVEVEGAQEVVDATTGVSGSMRVVGALRDVGEYGIVLEEDETAAGGRARCQVLPVRRCAPYNAGDVTTRAHPRGVRHGERLQRIGA